MFRLRFFPAWLMLLVSITLMAAASARGLWMVHVPDKDRTRENPYDSDPQAIAAGARLFHRNCAQCHGEDATGRGHHPSLRTDRVRTATPGELQWLLRNGSLRAGMPSWSQLPEQQRWQIVSYLKSLK